ncbi:hypothetical protein GCM10009839_24090 [Catenulispora yoronensis]|uniref:Uncharacterized protein n=1 Tax=Catenulispora yoronensis TaxID=450799 RepID=A0ABP5FI19_9ACTN
MFGKNRKLLRDGTPGRAVIVDALRSGGHLTANGGATPVTYRLRLRIHLPDGTTTDTECQLGGLTHSAHTYFSAGDIVPVRYDATDPTHATVDEAALLAEREAKQREAEAEAVERADRTLSGQPDPGPARNLPTDAAMRTAYDRWRTAAARTKEAKAAHKEAQRADDKGATLRAFNASVKRGAEERTARERYQELRKARPDWMVEDQ